MSLPSQDSQIIHMPNAAELSSAVSILLKEQGFPVDKNRLQSSLDKAKQAATPHASLETMLQSLGVNDGFEVLAAPCGVYAADRLSSRLGLWSHCALGAGYLAV